MKLNNYLFQRYQAVLYFSSFVLLIVAGLLLSPLLVLISYPSELAFAWGFILPSLLAGSLGALLMFFTRAQKKSSLAFQESRLVIVLCWAFACVFSSLPFMLIQKIPFVLALFESVSGWTTTGLSVIDVAKAPKVILMWRSITQFAGGLGFAIMMYSFISASMPAGLSFAEGRSDLLVPHVRSSAKIVLKLYIGYAVAGFAAYLIAGMKPFDAVNHVFAAISTGGFGTHAENIGYWDSVAVEAVTIPLMILGNLNFLTAYLLFRGRLGFVIRNAEVRAMSFLLPAGAAATFLLLSTNVYPTLGKSVRVAVFEAASALTTTGFTSTTYQGWGPAAVLVLTLLMLIGGQTCSTAGGIKQYRAYVAWKVLQWDIKRYLLPRTAVVEHYVWIGERKQFVTDNHIRNVFLLVVIYIMMYSCGVLLISAYGYSLQEALFEYASAMSTVGLSIGITAPTAPSPVLIAEIAGMFLGRLEFIAFLIGIQKLFHDSLHFVR